VRLDGGGQLLCLGRRVADVPPVTVTFGKIRYHPEAIMLAARPAEELVPVLEAAKHATREVTGNPGRAGNKLPWTPHVTIAYSSARQPAGPIIEALGQSLPERKVQISSVSLVNQIGPERDWNWHSEATVRLGATELSFSSQLPEIGDLPRPWQWLPVARRSSIE
jgi:2'-5' RNA ligase